MPLVNEAFIHVGNDIFGLRAKRRCQKELLDFARLSLASENMIWHGVFVFAEVRGEISVNFMEERRMFSVYWDMEYEWELNLEGGRLSRRPGKG